MAKNKWDNKSRSSKAENYNKQRNHISQAKNSQTLRGLLGFPSGFFQVLFLALGFGEFWGTTGTFLAVTLPASPLNRIDAGINISRGYYNSYGGSD